MSEVGLLLDSGGVLLCADGNVISKHATSFGIEVSATTAVRAISLADRDIDLRRDGAGDGFAAVWARYAGCRADAARELWRFLESEVECTELWGEVNEEAVRLFAELPPYVRPYVVSNSEGGAHAELVHHGLSRCVEGVLDSGAVGIAKPDPRIFEMAAVALGIPPDRCFYVGDTLGGAAAERTVLYDRFDVFEGCPGIGHQRIRDLAELLPLLAEAAGR